MKKVLVNVRSYDPETGLWKFTDQYESFIPETEEEAKALVNITEIIYGGKTYKTEGK